MLDHAAEERRSVDGDRADGSRLAAALACEAGHVAGDVQVGEHHVGRLEVLADDREDRLRDLALVRRPGDAQLQDVQRLQASALGLRLREVVGVRKGQAHVRGDVLQQLARAIRRRRPRDTTAGRAWP